MNSISLPVNEIFYSLQGEGGQTGLPVIFIRLSHCNLRCSYCDTSFSTYTIYSLQELLAALQRYPSHNILWTGGEPTLHLTSEIVAFFKAQGYRQSIETNGTNPVPEGIDYITCSPKPEAFAHLSKNFPQGVNEWRFPFGEGIPLPPDRLLLPKAENYFLSPIWANDKAINEQTEALNSCINYILKHPEWKLSVQLHKLLGFQ